MNRFVLLISFFCYFSLCSCQNVDGTYLSYDTICCDDFMVIVQLPIASVKQAQSFHYEEGFFITYPYVQYPIITCDYLEIHYGSMNKNTFLSNPMDSILYRRKIEDRVVSTKIIYNNICSRQDYYPNLSLTITYGYFDVDNLLPYPYGNSTFADMIMENIRIVKK